MIRASSEVNIVMAGPAGSPARRNQISSGLRRAGSLAVANFATAGIGGIDDRREVCPIHDKRFSSNHGGQLASHMHFVDHDLQIEGATRGGIHILLRVAQHAHFDAAAPSAVPRQLIVTGIAARCLYDVVYLGYLRAIGNEVEHSARVAGS
jgi:hypothetical protein